MDSHRGLLISGGKGSGSSRLADVELWVPEMVHCQVPAIPLGRYAHSQDGTTLCGGYSGVSDIQTSCITLTDEGTWETTTTLLQERQYHVSWASPSGLIIMGGRASASKETSEKIMENGTSIDSFPLEYDTAHACAINLGSTVVVTGGDSPNDRLVGQYNETGFIKYLPSLLQERYGHGCSFYNNA